MKYRCVKCGTYYEERCPDGPECKLDHPCVYCRGEVKICGQLTIEDFQDAYKKIMAAYEETNED